MTEGVRCNVILHSYRGSQILCVAGKGHKGWHVKPPGAADIEARDWSEFMLRAFARHTGRCPASVVVPPDEDNET